MRDNFPQLLNGVVTHMQRLTPAKWIAQISLTCDALNNNRKCGTGGKSAVRYTIATNSWLRDGGFFLFL